MLVSTIGFGCMPLFRILLRRFQLSREVTEEVVQYLTPLGTVIRHLIEAVFHLRGKIVVHQIAEVLFQTIGDNLTHFSA